MGNKVIAFSVLFLALMLVPNVQSATLTVCGSGCNSTTIQGAIDLASSGDTVTVGAGTYAEHLDINKTLDLQGTDAILNCSNRSLLTKTTGFIEVSVDNVTIEGFEIVGFNSEDESWDDKSSSSNFATIKLISGADNLKVYNNNFVVDGIATVGLLMHNDGDDDGGDNVEFVGNNLSGYSQCVVGHTNVDNLLVQNNIFIIPILENTDLAHDKAFGYGVQLWWGDNLQVKNNVFIGSWNESTGNYSDEDSLCNHYAVTTFGTYFAPYWDSPDRVCDIYAEDNIMNNLYLGIGSFAGGGNIEGNYINDNLIGLQLGQESGVWANASTAGLNITNNYFNDNNVDLMVQSFVDGNMSTYNNRFVGSVEYGILNEDIDTFNAVDNWWGSITPDTSKISGNVLYYPFCLNAECSVDIEDEITEFTGEDTTDFSTVTNWSSVDLVLDESNGKIDWSANIDLTDSLLAFDSYVAVGHNSISVDTSNMPELNQPAELTFKSSGYTDVRFLRVHRNGALCPASICTDVSVSSGDVIVTVTQMSGYSVVPYRPVITGQVPLVTVNIFGMLMGVGVLLATLGAGLFSRENMDIKKLAMMMIMIIIGLQLAVTFTTI